MAVLPDQFVDRLHRGIDCAVTGTLRLKDAALMTQFDVGGGHGASAADHLQGLQGIGSGLTGNRIAGQRDQIVVVDKLLLVTQFLEAGEDRCDLGLGQAEAELLKAGHHGVTAAVLGQRKVGAAPADFAGIHDLVGFAHLEDAVLMDAGSVSEGILADDRLAPGDLQTAQAADQSGCLEDLLGGDPGGESGKDIGTGLDRHDHLLQGGITGALTDAVESPLDLPGPGLNGSQGVGDGHPEIVVAMDADDRLVYVSDMLAKVGDQVGVLLRHRVADGIGDVHRGRARLDRGLNDLRQELRLGARSILG